MPGNATDDNATNCSEATSQHGPSAVKFPDRPRTLAEATPEELAAIAMLCVDVDIPMLTDIGPPPEGYGRAYITLLPYRPLRNGGDVLAEKWVYVGQQCERRFLMKALTFALTVLVWCVIVVVVGAVVLGVVHGLMR